MRTISNEIMSSMHETHHKSYIHVTVLMLMMTMTKIDTRWDNKK